jgi:hypothetical protein
MENEEGVKLICENFEYRTLGRLRFIGIDAWRTGEDWDALWARCGEFMPALDALMPDYAVYGTNKYDGDIGLAYYFTRDQILGEGVKIPYPHAYWHAAVYTDGRPKEWHAVRKEKICRFGYMFSVEE